MYRCMAVFVLCGVAGCMDGDYPALVHARSNAEIARIRAVADSDPEVIRARVEAARASRVPGMTEFEAEQYQRKHYQVIWIVMIWTFAISLCIFILSVVLAVSVLLFRLVAGVRDVPVSGKESRAEV